MAAHSAEDTAIGHVFWFSGFWFLILGFGGYSVILWGDGERRRRGRGGDREDERDKGVERRRGDRNREFCIADFVFESMGSVGFFLLSRPATPLLSNISFSAATPSPSINPQLQKIKPPPNPSPHSSPLSLSHAQINPPPVQAALPSPKFPLSVFIPSLSSHLDFFLIPLLLSQSSSLL